MRHAVILAGGGGTRLWPASRRARPKQLMITPTGLSLVGQTAARLRELGELHLVTSADQADAIRATLAREHQALAEDALVVEPAGRSTAAAIGLAAIHIAARDPGAVLGFFPADHYVAEPAAFRATCERAFTVAEHEAAIVTVGLTPTRPDPGFGYLELGARRPDGAAPVTRFVEKPSPAAASALIAGGCLWNAGMFFARADYLVAEIARQLPATGAILARIADALRRDPAEAAALTRTLYPTLESISFDHGVMEKTAAVLAMTGSFGWSDVGTWPALADWRPADASGNVRYGTALTLDAHDNLVVTDEGTVVVLVGVDDLVVVRSGDAILVVPRSRAPEVKDAVAALAAEGLTRFL